MNRIIIDCDTGIDDFFALLLACASKELQIEGITTVKGNVDLDYVIKNTCKALELEKRSDIPVYKGMEEPITKGQEDASDVHGGNGLGGIDFDIVEEKIQTEHAVDYLIREAKENPKEISIVTMGPLTNIAYGVKKDPEFAKRVKSLIIMGGAEEKGNITPHAEFNFYHDPEAAKIVFEAGFEDVVIVGLDVTTKLPLLEKYEEFLQKTKDELLNFLYDITRIGAKYDREVQGHKGYILNDPLTIVYLLEPNIMKLKEVDVNIIIKGEEIGKSEIITKNMQNSGTIKFAYEVDHKLFYEILFTRLFPDRIEEIKNMIGKV